MRFCCSTKLKCCWCLSYSLFSSYSTLLRSPVARPPWSCSRDWDCCCWFESRSILCIARWLPAAASLPPCGSVSLSNELIGGCLLPVSCSNAVRVYPRRKFTASWKLFAYSSSSNSGSLTTIEVMTDLSSGCGWLILAELMRCLFVESCRAFY